MRARLALSLVFLALGLWGCGRSESPRTPPAGPEGGEEVVVSDETPAEEAEAEDDTIANHNARVIEKASKSLPDNAKDLIALVEKDNAFRLADNSDREPDSVMREYREAIPRVIAAGKKLREIASEEDRKSEGYHNAMGIWLLYRAVYSGSDELDELVAAMKEILAAGPTPTQEAAQAAVLITDNFTSSDPQQALTLCRELIPILEKSDSPKVRAYATRLEGVARGLDLVGHTLEIKGTTLDGKPFDLTELRGKVVFVDFFTTWCGPCRAELPNVRKKYERYHDRGFEVVTISLDDDRQALDDFVKEEPIPWIMLYDGPWSENANAIYYGVSGVPDLILVDKEGKVVTHGWQGEVWRKKLPELLGVKDDDDKDDEAASDGNEASPKSDVPAAETETKASETEAADDK